MTHPESPPQVESETLVERLREYARGIRNAVNNCERVSESDAEIMEVAADALATAIKERDEALAMWPRGLPQPIAALSVDGVYVVGSPESIDRVERWLWP